MLLGFMALSSCLLLSVLVNHFAEMVRSPSMGTVLTLGSLPPSGALTRSWLDRPDWYSRQVRLTHERLVLSWNVARYKKLVHITSHGSLSRVGALSTDGSLPATGALWYEGSIVLHGALGATVSLLRHGPLGPYDSLIRLGAVENGWIAIHLGCCHQRWLARYSWCSLGTRLDRGAWCCLINSVDSLRADNAIMVGGSILMSGALGGHGSLQQFGKFLGGWFAYYSVL